MVLLVSVLTVCNCSQCAPEVCEESLGEGPSQREVGTKQLGQEDRGKTEGKCRLFLWSLSEHKCL